MAHGKNMAYLLLHLMMWGAGGFALHGQNSPYFTSGTSFSLPYLGRQAQALPFTTPVKTVKSRSYIQVTALTNTCGAVEVPNRGFYQRFYLQADSTLLLTLPLDTVYPDTISKAGITVQSQYPVQVVFATDVGMLDSTLGKGGLHPGPFSDSLDTEASAITPRPTKPLDYILNIANISHPTDPINFRPMQFWIHAPYDTTTVSLRLNGGDLNRGLLYDTFFDHTLYQNTCFFTILGLSYAPFPRDETLGFVGSDIKAGNGKPFLVFTGRFNGGYSSCTDLSRCTLGYGYGLHQVFDQAKPVTYGDTLYFAAQIQDHTENLYSILALEDSTAIKLNGNLLGYINKGRQIDTCYLGEAVFSSDKPTLLTLSRSGFYCDGPLFLPNYPNASSSSPFSITMPGSDELMKRSVLKPFSEDYENTYVVALFTKSADTLNFTLDGQPLPAASWKPFAAKPAWAWAQVEVNDKTHIIESSGDGFFGYHYSYAKKRPNYYFYPSYGYCLIESKAVPEDSLHFYIKTKSSAKEKLRDFDETVCVGEPFHIFPNAAKNVSWHWRFGGGRDTLQNIKNGKNTAITHSYAQPGPYWLTVKDTSGCTKGDSVLIQVKDIPQANFSASTMTNCKGVQIQLTNESTGASRYTWKLPGNVVSDEAAPAFNYDGNGEITVTLKAFNGDCGDSITKTIDLKSETFLPEKISNVFSPNGDGINDCYRASANLDFYTDCYDLSIFNRWGKTMWQSSNPRECWDGRLEGAEAAPGVYYYILNLGEEEFTGHLTLVR